MVMSGRWCGDGEEGGDDDVVDGCQGVEIVRFEEEREENQREKGMTTGGRENLD